MTDKATWGDFEVSFDQLLGRGGMGAVYRGRQISLDRPVAIKVLDTSAAPDEEFARGFLEKFVAEARALARVHDPRIITVYQAGRNDNKYWYAMELIDGKTVEDILQRDGMFDEKTAARIGADVARALDAAWREGIIHRDVKPPNIFILRDGSAKLGDFGIARSSGLPPSRLSQAHAILGTPTYVSPEQGLGGAVDHRSDIYSLGVVLYEMLAERPPLSGISAMDTIYKHANETPQPVRLFAPDVSEGMEQLVMCCLAKAPEDRFQTYAELIQALELVASGRTVTVPVPAARPAAPAPAPAPASVAPAAPPAASAPPPPARTGWLAVVVVLAVTVLGALIAFAWPRERRIEPVVAPDTAPVPPQTQAPPPPPPPQPQPAPPPPAPVELKRMPTIDEPKAATPSPGPRDTIEAFMEHEPSREEIDAIEAALAGRSVEHTPYTRYILECARKGGVPLENVDDDARTWGFAPGAIRAAATRGLEKDAKAALAAIDALRLPPQMRYALAPRAMLVEEIDAAELLATKQYGVLFDRHPRSRHVARAHAEILAALRASLLEDELVGQVEYRAWRPDVERGGRVALENERYAIKDAWIKKPFAGAKRGWQVRWSGDGAFVFALSPKHWIEVGPDGAKLWTEGPKSEPLPRTAARVVAVAPLADRVVVYAGDAPLAVVAGGLDEGIKIGAVGAVVVESIRVVDRE